MQIGDVQQRVARRANLAVDAEPLSHGAKLLQPGNAQLTRSPAHQPRRIHAYVVVARLKLVLGLVAHAYRRQQPPAQLRDVVVLMRRYRVLEPVEAQVVRRAPHIQRLAEVVPIVRVQHQLPVVARDVPDARHHLESVRSSHHARMYLVRAKARVEYLMRLAEVALRRLVPRRVSGVHLGLVAARAQQLVHRRARRLARDVPQRDIYGRPGVHIQPAPTAQNRQAAPQPLALECVASHNLRLQHIQYRTELPMPAAPEISDEAVALNALIRQNSQHALFHIPVEPAQVRVQPRIRQPAPYDLYLHIRNLHFLAPSFDNIDIIAAENPTLTLAVPEMEMQNVRPSSEPAL